ncbi:MAG: NAD-dependent epimerase/dehydratase family protein [Massilimicrobiota sp.]|nr:NAD-dependent epimerase/dehydratase family protein [Massilimicrobiota sp.]
MKKKVLILGGTGAMGKSLVKILEDTSYIVDVTSRKFQRSYSNIHYIQGNARDEKFLNQLLKNDYECIIDFMVYSTKEFSSKVDLFLNSTKQYVFLSSSRVYANSEKPITEDSPRLLDVCHDEDYLKTDEYALAKARQENLLINHDNNNYTILRPYITYNDNRLQLGILEKEYWLDRALNNKTIVFSKDISQYYTTLTYGYDVAYLMSKLILNDNALGEIFHITCSEHIKWEEILNIYLDELKKHKIYPKVKILDDSSIVDKRLGKHYQVYYDRLYNRIFDNTKILKATECENYEFKSIDQGLRMSLDSFINNHLLFNNKNYKIEALLDKICKENLNVMQIKSLKEKIKYIIFRYI